MNSGISDYFKDFGNCQNQSRYICPVLFEYLWQNVQHFSSLVWGFFLHIISAFELNCFHQYLYLIIISKMFQHIIFPKNKF